MIGWQLAALCAFFVKGLCGFANTLVFTTMLSFGTANASISPVELLLGYPTNALIAWRERKSVRWKLCLPLAALVVLGTLPGALLLKHTDAGIVKIVFGAAVMLIAAEMLLRPAQARAKQSPVLMGALGLLSGVLCGLYGVGALLGAYMSRVTEDTRAFRGNLCVVFLVENTLRVALYAAGGLLTQQSLLLALQLIPAMALGLGLGMLASRVVPERAAKKLVTVLLFASGAALIVNQL